MFTRLALLLSLCAAALFAPPRAAAASSMQEQPEIRGGVRYTFGSEIDFWAALSPENAARSPQVVVFWQAQGETSTQQAPLSPEGDEFRVQVEASSTLIRPFALVRYWFQVTFPDGETARSPRMTFRYEDNRFAWKTLESAPFQVHWYDGGVNFGQALLNEAQRALQASRGWLNSPLADTIHIYAYASPAEVQSALQLSGYNWVAGHTDPDLNVILVSLPPGIDQDYEIGRQIPHELMHILVHHYLGADAVRLPSWLDEGLASNAERIPNPDYAYLLQETYAGGRLIPLADLCHGFPPNAADALLAYAEAQSFTTFLHGQYGRSGIEALLKTYADGVDCERAPQLALGKSLSQLEHTWIQQTLAQSPWATLRESYPYLFLLGILLLVPLLVGWRRISPRGEGTISP